MKGNVSEKVGQKSRIVADALEYAAVKHEGKARKNPESRIPYIVHPVKVAMMLRDTGFDDEVVAAGLLHDTVEDSDATIEELAERFGSRVAGMVGAVTEPSKDRSWKERQDAYLNKVRSAGTEVLAISACDKIDNMRSMLQSLRAGHDIFGKLSAPVDRQLAKFDRLLEVYRGRVPEDLELLFAGTLQDLRDGIAAFHGKHKP